MGRCITTWRRKDRPLDSDYYVSENEDEARRVVHNLEQQGIREYRTFPLGDRLDHLSSVP